MLTVRQTYSKHLSPTFFRLSLLRFIPLLIFLFVFPPLAFSQNLESFEQRVTEHTLHNGWTFILVERPVAPVFAFMTRVNVGSAQEGAGVTGLAHMFEHMAFKGTPRLGTKDYAKEKVALEKLEQAYLTYQEARLDAQADTQHLKELFTTFKEKQRAASQFVKKNEFGDVIEHEGGVALNAFTSADVTGYFYALPSNKVELFAYLESERFLQPVFREFYEERDVVMEERRMRTESRPIGRLLEQFIATSFTAHLCQRYSVLYDDRRTRVLPNLLRAHEHGHGNCRRHSS